MWRTNRKSWLLLGAGLALGLSIGGALAVGVLLGQRSANADLAAVNELRLKAMATHGSDTFAVATGAVDDQVEGLYCLDFLTGDLQVYVPNPRGQGWSGAFKTNITTTLPPEAGKKPTYLMVTGGIQVTGGATGPTRPAASVCYVIDANTGAFAAYTFPWSKGASNYQQGQMGEMQLITTGKARNLDLRE